MYEVKYECVGGSCLVYRVARPTASSGMYVYINKYKHLVCSWVFSRSSGDTPHRWFWYVCIHIQYKHLVCSWVFSRSSGDTPHCWFQYVCIHIHAYVYMFVRGCCLHHWVTRPTAGPGMCIHIYIYVHMFVRGSCLDHPLSHTTAGSGSNRHLIDGLNVCVRMCVWYECVCLCMSKECVCIFWM